MGDDVYIPIKEAALSLRVSENTVRRMFDSGNIRGCRTPGGHRRILREDVNRYLPKDDGIKF